MILGIYGSGGLGREIYEIALRRNEISSLWTKIIFIDDINEEGKFFNTDRIKFDSLKEYIDQVECIVAVGEPSTREKLYNKLKDVNINITALIDPTAITSPTCTIKEGTIICEYSTIHTGVEIGNNVLVQPFCDIGHDIKIGNHSILSPFCAPGGNAIFGDRTYVGMHSTVKERLIIGNDVIIGMGSVVFKDIPDGMTAVGNPARITKGNDAHEVFK